MADTNDDQPPRDATYLGQKQLMATAKALLRHGTDRPIEGLRVTRQKFDVVLDDDAPPLLRQRWEQRDDDELDDEARVNAWVGWCTHGPSEVFVGRQKVGVLSELDTADLGREAHDAGHGNHPILAAGYTRLTDQGWSLRLVIRRDHSDAAQLG